MQVSKLMFVYVRQAPPTLLLIIITNPKPSCFVSMTPPFPTTRSINARELISHDIRSNIYNYKHTSCVEIVPLCKDEVVCLPPALAKQLGDIAQICVVIRVTSSIYVIDPSSCRCVWMVFFKYLTNNKIL